MLKFGNTFVNFGGSYLSGYKVPTYNVILQQSEGGIIGASPMTGNRNTEVTLSNTPSQNYFFNGYEISGANLYNTNKFKFVDSDVTAKAKWTYDWPDPNPLNLPTNTMRVKCYPGSEISSNINQYQLTKVGTENGCSIYDIKTTANNWNNLAGHIKISQSPTGYDADGISDILGVNNSAITSVQNMFIGGFSEYWTYAFCNLSSICYFDMSNVVNAHYWFADFDSSFVSYFPIYNTSSVKTFEGAFAASESYTYVVLDCTNCSSLKATFVGGYYFDEGDEFKFPTLKNTNNVENWDSTFQRYAISPLLKTNQLVIPDYDFSNATNVTEMLAINPYVSGGISSTYAKLSALGNQITAHSACFRNCGISSDQGRAELALIPNDWK